MPDQARERLLVGTKYGNYAIDPFRGYTSDFYFSPGIELNSMIYHEIGDSDTLVVATNVGIHTIPLENGLPLMEAKETREIGSINVIMPLNSESSQIDFLFMGGENVWRSRLAQDTLRKFRDNIPRNPLVNAPESNATVLSAGHATVLGRTPLLLIGTDIGLIGWNTTDGQEDSSRPWWIFR